SDWVHNLNFIHNMELKRKKKKKIVAKDREECCRCVIEILKIMEQCQKSVSMSRKDRWLIVTEVRELLKAMAQMTHHIRNWFLGGDSLIQSLSREFLKTVIVSTRKLRHITRMKKSIKMDISMLEKLL
ncbi:unnamed protein product, partial [Meganyctiphanes norvegica]